MGNTTSSTLVSPEEDDIYGFRACTSATAQLKLFDNNEAPLHHTPAPSRRESLLTEDHQYPGRRHSSITDQLRESLNDPNNDYDARKDSNTSRRSLSLPSSTTHSFLYDLRLEDFLETCVQLKVRSIVADAIREQAEMEVQEEMEKHRIVCEKLDELEDISCQLKDMEESVEECKGKLILEGGKTTIADALKTKMKGKGRARKDSVYVSSQRQRQNDETLNSPAQRDASHEPKPLSSFSPPSQTNIIDFHEAILDREEDIYFQPLHPSSTITLSQILKPSSLLKFLQSSSLPPLQLHTRLLEWISAAEAEVKVLQKELQEIRSDLEFGLLRVGWQVKGSGAMNSVFRQLCEGILEERKEKWERLREVAVLEGKSWPYQRSQVEEREEMVRKEKEEDEKGETVEARDEGKGKGRMQWFRFDSLFSQQ